MDAPVIILALVGIGTIVYEGVWGNGANKGKDKGQISR
jgi:hypothetical protein